jgi:hypothetical protein
MMRVLLSFLFAGLLLMIQPSQARALMYETPFTFSPFISFTGITEGTLTLVPVNDTGAPPETPHLLSGSVKWKFVQGDSAIEYTPDVVTYYHSKLTYGPGDKFTVLFVPNLGPDGGFSANYTWPIHTGPNSSTLALTASFTSPAEGSNRAFIASSGGHNAVPEIPVGAAVPLALLLGVGVYYLRRRQA